MVLERTKSGERYGGLWMVALCIAGWLLLFGVGRILWFVL